MYWEGRLEGEDDTAILAMQSWAVDEGAEVISTDRVIGKDCRHSWVLSSISEDWRKLIQEKTQADLLCCRVDVLHQRQLLDEPLPHLQQQATKPRRHEHACEKSGNGELSKVKVWRVVCFTRRT